jgi:hypothetical protein
VLARLVTRNLPDARVLDFREEAREEAREEPSARGQEASHVG